MARGPRPDGWITYRDGVVTIEFATGREIYPVAAQSQMKQMWAGGRLDGLPLQLGPADLWLTTRRPRVVPRLGERFPSKLGHPVVLNPRGSCLFPNPLLMMDPVNRYESRRLDVSVIGAGDLPGCAAGGSGRGGLRWLALRAQEREDGEDLTSGRSDGRATQTNAISSASSRRPRLGLDRRSRASRNVYPDSPGPYLRFKRPVSSSG